MKETVCQSCGMPMKTATDHGTNHDAGVSGDYCRYCFENGTFTQEVDMDGMIEHCLTFLDEYNRIAEKPLNREEAVMEMRQVFPQLKRWSKS